MLPGVITLTQPNVPEAKVRGSQKGFQWVILGLETVPGVLKGVQRGPLGPPGPPGPLGFSALPVADRGAIAEDDAGVMERAAPCLVDARACGSEAVRERNSENKNRTDWPRIL